MTFKLPISLIQDVDLITTSKNMTRTDLVKQLLENFVETEIDNIEHGEIKGKYSYESNKVFVGKIIDFYHKRYNYYPNIPQLMQLTGLKRNQIRWLQKKKFRNKIRPFRELPRVDYSDVERLKKLKKKQLEMLFWRKSRTKGIKEEKEETFKFLDNVRKLISKYNPSYLTEFDTFIKKFKKMIEERIEETWFYLVNLNIKEKEEQIIPFRFPEKFLLTKEPNVREDYKNKVNPRRKYRKGYPSGY